MPFRPGRSPTTWSSTCLSTAITSTSLRGTVAAAPSGAPTFEAGRIGSGAVHVSNAGDASFFNYVTLGAPPELNFGGSTDFTISTWVKINSHNSDPSFLSNTNKDWRAGDNTGWVVFVVVGGNLGWNYRESGSGRLDAGGPALNDGNWHHIAVSYDRDGNALTYHDGVLARITFIGPATETLDSGLPTNIGQDGTGTYVAGDQVAIDALMDDAAIWRRALTGFEIQRIHQFGTNGVRVSDVPDPAVVTLADLVADTVPAANATDVLADAAISAIIFDGALPLDNNTVQLSFNGSPVAVSIDKVGIRSTVTHQPASPLPNGSTNTVRIIFGDGVTSITSLWSFVVITPTTVRGITGHWDFDSGGLAAIIGQALEYRGGPAGLTASDTRFGSTTSFGIPGIQGNPVNVMATKQATNTAIGYLMNHGARPNGDPAATKVNQWTLIMDIFIPTEGWHSFIQIDDPNNSPGNDGDLFVNPGNGLGISSSYQGNLSRGEWHRVAFAVDSAEVISKFIDGVNVNDQTGWSGKGLNGRHALLPTALLFADEDGESQPAYVNSIQIRNYKMSNEGIAALGGPSAEGIPLVSGQWDFNAGDLVATIGTDLAMRPDTEFATSFGTAVIDSVEGKVMRFNYPASPTAREPLGYILPHGILPNGGGEKVNQYTIIMDLMFPASSTGFRSLLQVQTNNALDGDLFLNAANGLGISSVYHGNVTPDVFHRVAITVDLTKRELGKYIDGTNVVTVPAGSAPLGTGLFQYLSASEGNVDQRWALDPIALLFADEDGETAAGAVNSIQTRPGILSAAEIARLGKASAAGIPAVIPAVPSLTIRIGDFGIVTVSWAGDVTGYILESSPTLGTGAVWTTVDNVFNNSFEEFRTPAPSLFYRLRKAQ